MQQVVISRRPHPADTDLALAILYLRERDLWE